MHPSTPRQKTLLIVDDERDLLTSLDSWLSKKLPTVQVLTAASGADGLALVKSRSIDVILTDFRMPAMDGVEFLNQARKQQKVATLILMTADRSEATMKSLRAADANLIMPKPFDPDLFVEALQSWLGIGASAGQPTSPGLANQRSRVPNMAPNARPF